ncbi:MAG: hypothetical protein JRG97_04145 [Deltaproteobacteria bacterium]|nr:hypothetical protein [Deltaproteobacteria bacterium]MBW2051709.1 hypothetical protein [Deltaproteobacteria bacterium]MBW2140248.1 hypothetical protein [Deltaproteobacteria bacterium]MBW2323327.1 hypothetical protein [Deltaproteobacteria bacterium]
MITHKKEFTGGVVLFLGFMAVLVIMFLPVFNGQNGLKAMDSLYNSISKGSVYYIPELKGEAEKYKDNEITVTIAMSSEQQAKETVPLFEKGGAQTELSGKEIKVSGNLQKIIVNCLEDADHMFANNGEKVKEKYNYAEKKVLYNWWKALKAMDKNLTKQKKFSEAKFISSVGKKAVECSYNYYEIEPQKIADKYGIVFISLLFYIVYTIWYGFSIMFMFEGWGLKLED